MVSIIKTLSVAFLLVFSFSNQQVIANDAVVVEKPSAFAMMGDLVIVRPIMLSLSVLGTAAYLVSLPLTLAGGNAGEAGNVLVVKPLKTTFIRCLGCVKPGYKKQVNKVEGTR